MLGYMECGVEATFSIDAKDIGRGSWVLGPNLHLGRIRRAHLFDCHGLHVS